MSETPVAEAPRRVGRPPKTTQTKFAANVGKNLNDQKKLREEQIKAGIIPRNEPTTSEEGKPMVDEALRLLVEIQDLFPSSENQAAINGLKKAQYWMGQCKVSL